MMSAGHRQAAAAALAALGLLQADDTEDRAEQCRDLERARSTGSTRRDCTPATRRPGRTCPASSASAHQRDTAGSRAVAGTDRSAAAVAACSCAATVIVPGAAAWDGQPLVVCSSARTEPVDESLDHADHLRRRIVVETRLRLDACRVEVGRIQQVGRRDRQEAVRIRIRRVERDGATQELGAGGRRR